jgi:hypothetical protein
MSDQTNPEVVMTMLRARSVAVVVAALMLAGAPSAHADDTLYTAEGYAIGMRVSASYDTGPALEQGVLTTLNGLIHGPELASLHVQIETPQEVARDCGAADALACYSADAMVVPGEQVADGPPVPFLVAHEYAHHVLAHRRNDPWFASDWGSKRWASVMRVCPAVRNGELFLGYWTIPAEAFAESYAAMLFPDIHYAWGYDLRLSPTAAAKAAIRADVMQPWLGPTVERSSGRLARGGRRAIRLVLPLDGNATFTVRASRPIELTLLNGRRAVATARGRRARVSYSVCGQRRLTLRVSAPAGATAYRLTTSRP